MLLNSKGGTKIVKKAKPSFNRQEKAILKVTAEARRPMSIKEVAEKAHMSWTTAKKYMLKLEKRGWLKKE